MVEITIIKGNYGKHEDGRVKLYQYGDSLTVDAAEATRLVSLGVAEIIGRNPPPIPAEVQPESIEEQVLTESAENSPIDLNALSTAELRKMATEMGYTGLSRATKTDLISKIELKMAESVEDAPDFSLTAESPVV